MYNSLRVKAPTRGELFSYGQSGDDGMFWECRTDVREIVEFCNATGVELFSAISEKDNKKTMTVDEFGFPKNETTQDTIKAGFTILGMILALGVLMALVPGLGVLFLFLGFFVWIFRLYQSVPGKMGGVGIAGEEPKTQKPAKKKPTMNNTMAKDSVNRLRLINFKDVDKLVFSEDISEVIVDYVDVLYPGASVNDSEKKSLSMTTTIGLGLRMSETSEYTAKTLVDIMHNRRGAVDGIQDIADVVILELARRGR